MAGCTTVPDFGAVVSGGFFDGFKLAARVRIAPGWSGFKARFHLSPTATGEMYVALAIEDIDHTILHYSLSQTNALLSPGGYQDTDYPTGLWTSADSANAAYLSVWGKSSAVASRSGRVSVAIVNWYGDCEGTSYCAYGTQIKPAVAATAIITASSLSGIAFVFPPFAPIAAIFDAVVGIGINTKIVCSGPPPPVPEFTRDDFIPGTFLIRPTSAYKIMDAYVLTYWSQWCECMDAPPGAAPPVEYPPPEAPPLPPDIPTGPQPIVCDTSDPCSTFNQLIQIINNVAVNTTIANSYSNTINNSYVSNTNTNVTDSHDTTDYISNVVNNVDNSVTSLSNLVAPVGYTLGTPTEVAGSGTLAVSGILGLAVHLSALTGYEGASASTPTAIWTNCHISVGTADGSFERKPLRHVDQLFDCPPFVTSVGYHLAGDVSATITPLLPIASPG